MNDRAPPVDSHPALRTGVDALLALEPDYDVDAGVQRFERAVGSGSATTSRFGARARLVIVTAVVVAAAAVIGTRTREPAHALAPGLSSLAPVARPVAPPPEAIAIAAPVEIGSDAVERAPPPAEPKATPKPRRARAPVAAQPDAPPEDVAPADDSLAREMALLDEARRQLVGGEASSARKTIASARSTLTRLRFDEEWDALEILALAGAGELSRAESRASAFLVAHPNGRFNASIEAALARARKSE